MKARNGAKNILFPFLSKLRMPWQHSEREMKNNQCNKQKMLIGRFYNNSTLFQLPDNIYSHPKMSNNYADRNLSLLTSQKDKSQSLVRFQTIKETLRKNTKCLDHTNMSNLFLMLFPVCTVYRPILVPLAFPPIYHKNLIPILEDRDHWGEMPHQQKRENHKMKIHRMDRGAAAVLRDLIALRQFIILGLLCLEETKILCHNHLL